MKLKYLIVVIFLITSLMRIKAQDAAALIPHLQAIMTTISKGNLEDAENAFVERLLAEKNVAFLAQIVETGHEMKEIYDKLEIDAIKDLYKMYQSYACVATRMEYLLTLAERGDCVFDFQLDKALLKFNTSKELVLGLGMLNAGFKLTHGEKINSLKAAVELLEESFSEMEALNNKLIFQIRGRLYTEEFPQINSGAANIDYYQQGFFKKFGLQSMGINVNDVSTTGYKDNSDFKNQQNKNIGDSYFEDVKSLTSEEDKGTNKMNKMKDDESIKKTKTNFIVVFLDWVFYMGLLLGFVYVIAGFALQKPDKSQRLISLGVGFIIFLVYVGLKAIVE